MKRAWFLLPGLVFLAVACEHDAGHDDAMAQCEAAATKAMEAADPDPDQRVHWRELHVRQCMADKGFTSLGLCEGCGL
jgi:hypothetical protein